MIPAERNKRGINMLRESPVCGAGGGVGDGVGGGGGDGGGVVVVVYLFVKTNAILGIEGPRVKV